MQEPEFPREYQGKYLQRVGNVFSSSQIQTCIDLGEEFNTTKVPVSNYTLKSVGVDFGWSSPGTGIVVLEHIKTPRNIIRVIDSYLIEKGDPNQVIELLWSMYKQFSYMNVVFFCDGADRASVNLAKIKFNESLSWDRIKDFGHNSNIKIRPVNFNSEHKNMLSHLHAMVSKGYLAIPVKHDKLITSLRTAFAEELNLKKDQTSYSDLLDALLLSLKGYQIE